MNKKSLKIIHGDCCEHLKKLRANSIDLVVTSPPYAQQRKGKYSGEAMEDYEAWFLPIASEIKRVLKPTGSFFLNMKAHCENKERTLYVMELVLKLRNEIGFKYVDEYIWYKSSMPGKKCFRLKNSWEPIYHFAKNNSYINHEAIKIRSKFTFKNKRGWTAYSQTGNVGGYHAIADQGEGFTDPDNILYFPTALLGKDRAFKHPAKFPIELVQFLIKGFCPPKGKVLDPFAGSGVTALAALQGGYRTIAIEKEQKYCDMIQERIDKYNSEPLRASA